MLSPTDLKLDCDLSGKILNQISCLGSEMLFHIVLGIVGVVLNKPNNLIHNTSLNTSRLLKW